LVPIPEIPVQPSSRRSELGKPAEAVVAIAFILPERMCGKAEERLRNATGASPAMIAGIIWPAPPL